MPLIELEPPSGLGVHVEGERRRWAAPAQGLIGDCVIEEVGTGATPFARDGQRQEAFVAKAPVIFDRSRVTLDELLSDAVMAPVLRSGGYEPDEFREMMTEMPGISSRRPRVVKAGFLY